MLFASVAIKRPSILLIDEPEINLHPALQVKFLTRLSNYVETGRIMFATHSIGLARLVGDHIYSFVPSENGTVVKKLEQTPNFSQFAGELGYSTFHELGYEKLLLVEGPTEVRTIQQFLRLLNKDQKVVMLSLCGNSLIDKKRAYELNELKRICPKISVLIDRESDSDTVPDERNAFAEECGKLGFDCHILARRAIENYFPEYAIKAAKGPSFRSLAKFEKLKDLKPSWDKNDNWLIAQKVDLKDILDTDLGVFLSNL